MTNETKKEVSKAITAVAKGTINLGRLVADKIESKKRGEARLRLCAISYQMTALSNLLLDADLSLPPMESKAVEQVFETWTRPQ